MRRNSISLADNDNNNSLKVSQAGERWSRPGRHLFTGLAGVVT